MTLEIESEVYSPEQILEGALSDSKGAHLKQLEGFLRAWYDDGATVEVGTSGSTGERKRIELPKAGMRASARMTIRHYGIPEEGKALLCLSSEYIAGKMMLVRALEGDWSLRVLPPSRDPVGELAEGEKFDFSALVPLQLREALMDHEKRERSKQLGTVIIGGAPLTSELEKRVRSLPNPFYATYGMTETMTHIADRRLNGDGADDHFTPMAGVELESDRRGCLKVRAPHLLEEEVCTNDLISFREDGAFYIRGRFDRLINSGAVKVLPEELERKLDPMMDRRFFIDKEPDEELGERVVLFIEGEALDPTTEGLLRSRMKELLEAYEAPRAIHYVPNFRETGSGKVDREGSKAELA